MSMSRKDFEALAAVARDFHGYDDRAELAPAWVAERLADVCQLASPAFDRPRFLAACEPNGSFRVAVRASSGPVVSRDSDSVERLPGGRFVYGLVSKSGVDLFGVVDRGTERIATWGYSEPSQHSSSEREDMRACLDASRGFGATAPGFYWESFDSLLRVFPDSVMDR